MQENCKDAMCIIIKLIEHIFVLQKAFLHFFITKYKWLLKWPSLKAKYFGGVFTLIVTSKCFFCPPVFLPFSSSFSISLASLYQNYFLHYL